jgi:hypothetical protein
VKFKIHDAGTPDGLTDWIRAWTAWPGREVLAHPEFARLFARPCDRVVCAAGEDAGGSILFPLILRPLSAEPWARAGEARWDATTPYGYGGPYAWGAGPRDDDAFWRAHAEWCREGKIVSTFARLSLFPEQLAAIPGPVESLLPNIVVPLGAGPDGLWAGYESKVRKWVKSAEAAGITVEEDPTGARIEDFFAVYTETMTRRGAADWYFFPREFFKSIIEKLPGQFVFFYALLDGKVLSSDLMLCSKDYVYYFLGGTHEAALPQSPNYLLKHRIATWAAAEGKKGYVLGGGYEPGDGLFRYKRAFARTGEVPFKTACLIHDEAGCRDLVSDRAAREALAGRAWTPRSRYFPPYRA